MAAHSTPTDLLRNSTVQSLQNLALYVRRATTSTVPNLTSNAPAKTTSELVQPTTTQAKAKSPANTQAQAQLQTQAQARVQD